MPINSPGHSECDYSKWIGDDADYDSPQERERYAQRRKDTDIPAGVEHQSKPDIALNLIEQAVAVGVNHGCVIVDRHFEEAKSFRRKSRGIPEPYVVEISPTEFRSVPEDTDLIQPDDYPNRKHSAHSDDVSSKIIGVRLSIRWSHEGFSHSFTE